MRLTVVSDISSPYISRICFLNVRNQRKSSSCGIGFQPGLYKDLHLTVFVVVTYDLTLDRDSLVLEVDCIPPQTKYLASSKTIICCNVHYKFQFVALENLKQFIQLISIVEGSFVPVSSRYYQLVHRVLWYQFHFYSVGECGIKENGVLSPIIVQPIEDGYEILIGHNRWNASKLAGLPTVPAIVKTDLTEEEAEMYVIESNVMQRGFENLRISEQAAAVALRHSEMFSQGKRNDILRELAHLENPSAEPDSSTLNPVGSKLDTSESVGKEYGVSKGSVVRLIRINRLIDELKALVDSGELSIRAGVELSFLSDDTQAVVAECTEDCKIDMKKAKMLRASADDEGNIDRYTVESIISGEDGKAKPKPKSVKISNDTYTKYFSEGVKAKEITETIEKALAFYFENMEEN